MKIGDRVITTHFVDPYAEGLQGVIIEVFNVNGVFDCRVAFEEGGSGLYYFNELVQIGSTIELEIKEIDWV